MKPPKWQSEESDKLQGGVQCSKRGRPGHDAGAPGRSKISQLIKQRADSGPYRNKDKLIDSAGATHSAEGVRERRVHIEVMKLVADSHDVLNEESEE